MKLRRKKIELKNKEFHSAFLIFGTDPTFRFKKNQEIRKIIII